MTRVTYQPIRGFEGYRVGSDGTVWSCWSLQGRGRGVPPLWVMSENWKELSPAIDSRGRKSFRLRTEENTYVRKLLTTLMAEAFGRKTTNARD